MNNSLQNIFSGWRVTLAIIIGLSVSLFLLLNSIYQENYIEAVDGNFVWQDTNNNGLVDYNDPSEFV